MKRKVLLDGERFISCDVSNSEHIDVYTFACAERKEEIRQAMILNGYWLVDDVFMDDEEEANDIVVNRKYFNFKGEKYYLNQCSDIFEWFGESQNYDFTYYYDRIVFNTPRGIIAAYIEDTSNYTRL